MINSQNVTPPLSITTPPIAVFFFSESLKIRFREKIQKLLFVFRKLYCENSHFFAKMNEQKMRKRSEFFVAKTICSTLYSVFFYSDFFFEKFSHFLRNRWKRNFAKKRKFSHFRKQTNGSEIFAKRFFFFVGNPTWGEGSKKIKFKYF